MSIPPTEKRKGISRALTLACLALGYILADRVAFEVFEESDREEFSEGLIHGLAIHTLAYLNAELNEQNLNDFQEMCRDHIQSLAPYAKTIFPEKDSTPAGTLIWEFSKHVGEINGYPDDIGIVMPISIHASTLVSSIDKIILTKDH
jgi:hypothetical protein